MLGTNGLFTRRLLRWYDQAQRDLPWRNRPGERRSEPYAVLVSEAMLQQTQVATVIPYFQRFMARFPTIAALAAADEQEVLRLWQGLGYYSRARNLLAAARTVMREHGGVLPGTIETLLLLPGIGRYTAGAIASIAFDQRAPILDGNVQRVICRLDRVRADPRQAATRSMLWAHAEALLPSKRVGDFNSALMELGATVCTPRQPDCGKCPVRQHCQARVAGERERIPVPRKAKPTPLCLRHVFCIRAGNRWLIEQRPSTGRWASMWQFVTVKAPDAGTEEAAVAAPLAVANVRKLGSVSHALTHRRYRFTAFKCDAAAGQPTGKRAEPRRRWVRLRELREYPLPKPHLRIAEMLGGQRRAKRQTGRLPKANGRSITQEHGARPE